MFLIIQYPCFLFLFLFLFPFTIFFSGLHAERFANSLGVPQLARRTLIQQTVWLFSDADDLSANLAVNLMNLSEDTSTRLVKNALLCVCYDDDDVVADDDDDDDDDDE